MWIGVIEAAIIFHGQGSGMDQWYRGPKLITSYSVPQWFVWMRHMKDLQIRFDRQRFAVQSSVFDDPGADGDGDLWESDDDSIVDARAMDQEVKEAPNRPSQSNHTPRPRNSDSNDTKGLRGWIKATGAREIQILKELKQWEEKKAPDELDRLRHLKNWAERNGFTGLTAEAPAVPTTGNYIVSGDYWPRLTY